MWKLWLVTSFFVIVSTFAVADIVFLSDRDGRSNVYVMQDDGSAIRQLTNTPFSKGDLAWAPDGRQITYAPDLHSADHRQRQQVDIFLLNADGTGERNLTQHPALDAGASWSPDGKLLAFTSTRGEGWELYMMEIATRKVQQLTRLGFAVDPDWSPDGKHIAFEREGPRGRHIYTMNADGRNVRPLLRRPRQGQFGNSVIVSSFASWSPDGKYILYSEQEYVPNRWVADSILVVNKETRHPKVLDTPQGWKINTVCWADDGDAVLFAGVPKGFGNIYKIYKYRLSNGQLTNLTPHPSDNWGMDWTPYNSLAVSAREKLTTLWARLKAASRASFIPQTPVTASN